MMINVSRTTQESSTTLIDINNTPIIEKEENEKYETTVNVEEEKTINLFSTFDEPSIDFAMEKINLGGHYGNVEMTQIRGLKDKSIENKINNDIKGRYLDEIKLIEEKDKIQLSGSDISLKFSCFR